jgi:radical SAM/Cys-rich protein
MSLTTYNKVLEFAKRIKPTRLDITGGAPELHPHLYSFIESATRVSNQIQIRTNLTVLSQPGMDSLLSLFRDNQIKIIASLPCYYRDEVDAQRGDGVFQTSIQMLQQLNQLGYGLRPNLLLDLVHNPEGAFLPPPQSELETVYRKILQEKFNIAFNQLLTITNMPIGRFRDVLEATHQKQSYLGRLRSAFNPNTLDKLMCRHQIHVGPSGRLYDCDFNFALGIPTKISVDDLQQISSNMLLTREILTGDHCFGCTAGSGSSCEGALSS